MRDANAKGDTDENVENLEIVECRICGYHFQKTKKCPQCSIKERA